MRTLTLALIGLLLTACTGIIEQAEQAAQLPEISERAGYNFVHYAACQTHDTTGTTISCEGYKTNNQIAAEYGVRGHAVVFGPYDPVAMRYEWVDGVGPAPGTDFSGPISWVKKGRTFKVRLDTYTHGYAGTDPTPWDGSKVYPDTVFMYPNGQWVPVFPPLDTAWISADLINTAGVQILQWWGTHPRATW